MSQESLIMQSYCYLSTPEHIRSFFGSFIYIYTGKGELCLTDTTLQFVGRSGLPVEIPLHSITDIYVGNYSRWAKPIRLDYIAVRHGSGEERTLLFTPTRSWLTPVWETNKIVAEWVRALEDTRLRGADPIAATNPAT